MTLSNTTAHRGKRPSSVLRDGRGTTPAGLALAGAAIALLLGGCGILGINPPPPTWTEEPPTQRTGPGGDILAQLPDQFVFTSGAGGWSTTLTMSKDGTFTGRYWASHLGDTGADHPKGTADESIFSGRLQVGSPAAGDKYDVTVADFATQGKVGDTRIEDGVLVTTAEPYGITAADTKLVVYAPGASTDGMSQDFLKWLGIGIETRPYTLPYWVLGIPTPDFAFYGISNNDWTVWNIPAELSRFVGQPWDDKLLPSAENVGFTGSDMDSPGSTVTAVEIWGKADGYGIMGVQVGDNLDNALKRFQQSTWTVKEQVAHAAGFTTTVLYMSEAPLAVQITAEANRTISELAVQQTSMGGPIRNLATPVGSPVNCSGIQFPDGVDKNLVCAPVKSPVKLQSFTLPDFGTAYGFQDPDGNLVCAIENTEPGSDNPSYVNCMAKIMAQPYPKDPANTGSPVGCQRGMFVGTSGSGALCSGGMMTADMLPKNPVVPVLKPGQTMVTSDYPSGQTSDAVACHVEVGEITCWNTVSYHGMKLTAEGAVFW